MTATYLSKWQKVFIFQTEWQEKNTYVYMYFINPNQERQSKKLQLLKPGVLVQEMTDLKSNLNPQKC